MSMQRKLITLLSLFLAIGLYAADEYCTSDAKRNAASRFLGEIIVSKNTNEGLVEIFRETVNTMPAKPNNSFPMYQDLTNMVVEANAGDELVLSYTELSGNFSWIHFYLFVDYNNDKEFEEELDELVSYTYFDGKNSLGETAADNPPPGAMPVFTVPANAPRGETRLRLKGDWNDKNPCAVNSSNATMIDLTIRINGPELEKYPVTFTQPAEGGIFKIMNGDTEISSGEEVEEGTILKIVAEPASNDYIVKSIMVNEQVIDGNSFTIEGATTVAVEFIKGRFINYTSGDNGTLTVSSEGVDVENNSVVELGKAVTIKAVPYEGGSVLSVTVNGEDKTTECSSEDGYTITVEDNITIHAEFEQIYCLVPGYNNSGSRVFNTITVNKALGEQQIEVFRSVVHPTKPNSRFPVHQIKTDEVMNVSRGDELVISYTGHNEFVWVHFYVFIDYNKDKIFSEADGELVSFTYYKGPDDELGVNSLGEETSDKDPPASLPKFTIPADALEGETRIRIISQWNSKNPCSVNGGNENVIDYTINIKDIAYYPVTFTQPAEGGVVKVMNGEMEITSGDQIQEGTTLTVEAELTSDEYTVRSVLVNDNVITGNQVIVSEPTTIEVDIIKGRLITYTVGEHGTLSVTNEENAVETNAILPKRTSINVKALPDTEYYAQSILINGEDKTVECTSVAGYTFTLEANTDIQASFDINKYEFTYTHDAKRANVVVRNDGATVNSGARIAYGTILSINVTPVGSNKIKSILVNGEDKINDLLPEGGNNFNLTINATTALELILETEIYTLTYNTPENGTMRVTLNGESITSGSDIPHGEYLELEFIPLGGYELESLKINNEDYLEFVDEDYLQYEIKGNVNIVATFAMPSSIDGLSENNVITFINSERNVVIENAPLGSKVEIYNIVGQPIAATIVNSSVEMLTGLNLTESVYLIKISFEHKVFINKLLKK